VEVEYDSIPAADLFALCKNPRNDMAWREFCRRYHPLLVRTARRVASNYLRKDPELLADLVQDAYAKICRKFDDLHAAARKGDGGEVPFLRTFAQNANHDYLRRLRAKKRGALVEIPLEASFDHPSEEAAMSIDEQVLVDELLRALESAPSRNLRRDINLFRLHFEQGFSAERIARIPGIGLSHQGVDGVIRRLLQHLRDSRGGDA
jgi:RNA polymerase sigma factor (sigma-70 family)